MVDVLGRVRPKVGEDVHVFVAETEVTRMIQTRRRTKRGIPREPVWTPHPRRAVGNVELRRDPTRDDPTARGERKPRNLLEYNVKTTAARPTFALAETEGHIVN